MFQLRGGPVDRGFHNCPEDFDYLLWTWKDYAIRWLMVISILSVPIGMAYVVVTV